jgi:hypothetical protein
VGQLPLHRALQRIGDFSLMKKHRILGNKRSYPVTAMKLSGAGTNMEPPAS